MRLLFILIIMLSPYIRSHAQRYYEAFNRITAEDGTGLLANNITALYQDEQGFLWVGNSNGLQRFDGHNFIKFDQTQRGRAALPEVEINRILPAGKGKLWIAAYATRQFGIFDVARNSFTAVPLHTEHPLPARSAFTMWQDHYGLTYINVFRYGKILVYDSTRKEFNERTPLNNLPEGWKATHATHHDALNRQYWIVCDKGLAVFDERSREVWTRQYNPKNIPLLNNNDIQEHTSTIYIDKQRRYWIVNWANHLGFYCYDASGRPLSDTAGLNGVNTAYAEPKHFYETSHGNLWIYGLANLYVREREAKRFMFHRTQTDNDFSIRYEAVNQVLEDRDGVLWFATDQGLFYSTRGSKVLGNLVLSKIPGRYNLTDILELRGGQFWLSTWGEGVLTHDHQFTAYPSPLYSDMPVVDRVTNIAYHQVWAMQQQSTTGKVYLGCQRGQLMIFDTLSGRTQYLHPPELENATIRSLTETKTGDIIIGTQNGKLFRYDGRAFYQLADLGAGAIVYKLIVDRDGLVWAGTQDMGVYAIDPANGKRLYHFTAGTTAKGLFSGTCMDVEQLTNDLIVAATSALTIINKRTGEVRTITTREGLPSNSVKRLRVDADGYLWMVTDIGLSRYDHQRNTFTTYGREDGVLLGDVVSDADHRSGNQLLVFAGVNNLLFFHQDALKSARRTPDVTFTQFFINDTHQSIDSLRALPEITLQQWQNDFSIRFACLDFRNRNKYTYYYQMKGLDEKWIRSAERNLVFKGLAPGHYILQVKAVNTEGVESANLSTLRIFVKPPFWMTGWFISSVITLVAFLAYAMHRLRIKRILAVEKIRNRVARDLHDDMGSTLSTINILSAMAKAKLNTDTRKTGEYISKIADNAQRMMEAMDDIVWAIKPANDSMQKVVGRMREFATNVLEAKDIELVFIAEKEVNDVKIDMEARRDVFLIFKEAVNNAAKYSKCKKAVVHVWVKHQKLKLQVRDDGVGFEVKNADSGNGLGNMRKRADALRARFEILSKPNEGTTVNLTVPLN